MKPQWESQIAILENALQQLHDLGERLPATYSMQGVTITTEEFKISFREIIGIIKAISYSESIDAILLAIHQPNVVASCNQIQQIISNLPSNPQPYLEQLTNTIWAIRSSLSWLVKPNMPENYFNSVTNTELIGKIESTENLYKKLIEASKKIGDSLKEIINSDEQVKNLLSTIQGYEREAANAKTNAESSSSVVLTNRETAQELLKELESGKMQQEELLDKINALQEQAALVLEGNSKVALAKSFKTRRQSLEKNLAFWRDGFLVSIVSLIAVILLTSVGVLNLPPILKTDRNIDAWSVVARVLITGPIVWLTWFVARQYSHTLRLIEDYAFKEASALAFVGYKREMSEDEEMIKLLRETAIKNFGSPPTRMLSVKEPSSPLHEMIDNALRKGNLDKVIELIKAAKNNSNSE